MVLRLRGGGFAARLVVSSQDGSISEEYAVDGSQKWDDLFSKLEKKFKIDRDDIVLPIEDRSYTLDGFSGRYISFTIPSGGGKVYATISDAS